MLIWDHGLKDCQCSFLNQMKCEQINTTIKEIWLKANVVHIEIIYYDVLNHRFSFVFCNYIQLINFDCHYINSGISLAHLYIAFLDHRQIMNSLINLLLGAVEIWYLVFKGFYGVEKLIFSAWLCIHLCGSFFLLKERLVFNVTVLYLLMICVMVI